MALVRKRIRISDLTEDQKSSMYDLMVEYYVNITCNQFSSDLEEKDVALVLFDEESDRLVGFSTQKLIPTQLNGTPIGVLFSGDTVVAREFWGNMALSIAFGELMMDLLKENPGKEFYWMLISKGLRTYKYLPVYFNEYYPNWEKDTPAHFKELMDQLGKMKFPERYNTETGIIEARDENSQYLKEHFHPEPNPSKPHENFFTTINPGYLRGDELLCIARLSLDNIHPFMIRVLKNKQ